MTPADEAEDRSVDEQGKADAGPPEAQDLAPAEIPADEVLQDAKELERVPQRPVDPFNRDKHKIDLRLQRVVGYGGVALMVAQLIVANWVFIKYANTIGWGKIPTGAIQVWLAATVAQVIGVVFIIARSVFPEGGRR